MSADPEPRVDVRTLRVAANTGAHDLSRAILAALGDAQTVEIEAVGPWAGGVALKAATTARYVFQSRGADLSVVPTFRDLPEAPHNEPDGVLTAIVLTVTLA